MQVLLPDRSIRKQLMKELDLRHKNWKLWMVLFGFMLFLAALVMALDCLLLYRNPTSSFGVVIFLAAGLCFACIPWLFGFYVYNSARYKCAFPYSSYANGTLYLYEDRLEYLFWRVGRNEPAAYSRKRAVFREEDMVCYSIRRDQITSIRTEDNLICRIEGRGQLTIPDWQCEDQSRHSDKVSTVSEFSFLLAFQEENPIAKINNWRYNRGQN